MQPTFKRLKRSGKEASARFSWLGIWLTATFMLLRRLNSNQRQTQTQTGASGVNLLTWVHLIINTSWDTSKPGLRLKPIQTKLLNLKTNLTIMIRRTKIRVLIVVLLMSLSVTKVKIMAASCRLRDCKQKLTLLMLKTVRRGNALWPTKLPCSKDSNWSKLKWQTK